MVLPITRPAVTNFDKRASELEELAAAEGIELPLSVEEILNLEDDGFVVDLRTGDAMEVSIERVTPSGRAVSHLLSPFTKDDVQRTPGGLYAPSLAEIDHVAASAKRRHPEMAGRIDKAAEILRSGSLQLEPVAWEKGQLVRWRIASQSHGGAYIVCGLHCPCQDSRAPMVGDIRHCCKHALAVALYMKILRNQFSADVRAGKIDLNPLGNGEFHAYAKRLGYCQVARLGRAVKTCIFVSHAAACHYSLWRAA